MCAEFITGRIEEIVNDKFIELENKNYIQTPGRVDQSAGDVERTDCTSAEE